MTPPPDTDACLRDALDGAGLDPRLADALAYSVLGPGKRVRPRLCRMAAEAIAERAEHGPAAAIAAAAVELIHAFSLIHDDLPELDDDDLRRGRPTLHVHTSHALALLAGDAAHTLAFRLLARVDDATLSRALTAELADATLAMIDGQVRDTLGVDDEPDAEALMRTHALKTGALIRCAVRSGALAAGATEAQLVALSAYADAVGLMFQAVDDLLDVTATADTLGKATQKDADAGKTTFPGLFGIDGTRARIARYRDDARDALAGFGASADPLRQFAADLAARDR